MATVDAAPVIRDPLACPTCGHPTCLDLYHVMEAILRRPPVMAPPPDRA